MCSPRGIESRRHQQRVEFGKRLAIDVQESREEFAQYQNLVKIKTNEQFYK
jgi:hypothetical protein